MTNNEVENLLKDYNFSDKEKEFLLASSTAIITETNQNRLISEFILGKRIEGAAGDVIKSGAKTAASNKRLTRVLVVVAMLQLILGIFQFLVPLYLNKDSMWIGLLVEILLFSAMLYVLNNIFKSGKK